jgi:hypothetical protein
MTGSVVLQEWIHESHSAQRCKPKPQSEVVGVRLIPEDDTSGCVPRWNDTRKPNNSRLVLQTRRPAAMKRRSAMVAHQDEMKPRIDRLTAGGN